MDNETTMPQQAEERMVFRTEDLVKKYGKRTVVNGVSFDVSILLGVWLAVGVRR